MIKVIGTIGPASINLNTLKNLKSKGLNSFRINLSHSNRELLDYYYEQFKIADVEPSLDTQGAQVRISFLKRKQYNTIDEKISIGYYDLVDGQSAKYIDIGLTHKQFFDQIDDGDEIKIGFDGLIVKVSSVDKVQSILFAKVVNVGEIDLNKAVDISRKSLQLPAFTSFDLECISESLRHGIKEIYVSFCGSSKCITQVKNMLREAGWSEDNLPKIIAKIENRQGLLDLENIVEEADGILIDRGDLSREIKISMIPGIVNKVIKTCVTRDTPCYVATNVLDSMMVSKLPSRAEISDIYNLLSFGISGFVLAAEVAIGSHPVESVEVVRYMSSVFFDQKFQAGIIPSTQEVIPDIKEPLLSWL
ncbi:pyruvate kinase [Synechococcus sp. HIMB2401]|uniref:pyruvate kinase n=1 Tax=Synechococcus sp. HIMB2401 TaxID=3144208 RepID=UPI0036F44A51